MTLYAFGRQLLKPSYWAAIMVGLQTDAARMTTGNPETNAARG